MSKKFKGFTLLECLSLQQPELEEPYIAYSKLCTDNSEQLWFLYFLQKLLGEAPDLPVDAVKKKN